MNTAAAPLNLTAEAAVKPEPVIATAVPTLPWIGANPLITGTMPNEAALVAVPSGVVTVIGPGEPITGTVALMVE